MKKTGLLFALIVILAAGMQAQYVRTDSTGTPSPAGRQKAAYQPSFWDKTSIGGNFGLQFGTYTLIAISPLLNYHINQSLIIGAGPIYQYYNIQDPYYGISYKGSIYGGRVVGMCYFPKPLQNIFIMGEYDLINVPYFDSFTLEYSRTTLTIPLVGGGYRQPVGDRMYFTLAGLWDLSGNPLSPYTNPLIVAGFDIGL